MDTKYTALAKSIIYKALKEYEENHYMNFDEEWQNCINELLAVFKQGA